MAADDPVIFTEKDYELLKEMAADYLSSRVKSPNRPYYQERKPQAPEVYLAHVGAGGLPAFSPGANSGTGTGSAVLDDTFGSATCSTWRRLDDGKVVEIGRNITVYNLTLTHIPQGSWILVVRDKSGTWWHDGGAGGVIKDYPLDAVSNVCLIDGTLTVEHTVVMALSGEVLSTYCITDPSDCCPVFVPCCAGHELGNLCAIISGGTGDFTAYNGRRYEMTRRTVAGVSEWVSAIAFSFDVSGTLSTGWRLYLTCTESFGAFSWKSGFVKDETGGRVPFDPVHAYCPPLDVQSHLFGAGPGHDGQLTLNVVEGDCPGGTGTGTGTGSIGGGGGTVSTPCCPAGLPTFLFLTITDVSGCACVAGTYQIAWDGTKWSFFGEGICGGLSFNASLTCTSSGSWLLSVVCDLFGSPTTWAGGVAPTCAFPIGLTDLVGIQSGPGPWCCTGNVTITITE